MSKLNVVIVGGGAAGVNAAKVLSRTLDSSKYQLILINPLPYRIWLIATLRYVVTQDEALKKDIFLPYDKIFSNGKGKFVQGCVSSFEASTEGGSVVLESGEKIEYVAICDRDVEVDRGNKLAQIPRPSTRPRCLMEWTSWLSPY